MIVLLSLLLSVACCGAAYFYAESRSKSVLSNTIEQASINAQLRVTQAQLEVKRLTDVIIEMRQARNFELPPGNGDKQWGAYSTGQADEDYEREQRRREIEKERGNVDAEVIATLEAELDL